MQAIERHFARLDGTHYPSLSSTTGSLRFDVSCPGGSRYWWVETRDGNVEVSDKNDSADCIVVADEEPMARVVTGEDNAIALLVRGTIAVSGNLLLFLKLQKVLLGPTAQVTEAQRG
ncbi:SCP2 sterol-binding domain-containing protein [Micromonospora sp. NPDC005324]|uniref:SCP2 sterol-binding domain-containing protein n=1 Tax=Micromonospora sp. NPDC005324 TaxID=3157033 RepID=UPI0033ABDF8A